MKLYRVIDPKFTQALNELVSLPVSVAFAYKLTDLMEKVESECKKWRRARDMLLQKYGEKDKAGKLKTTKDKTQYVMKDRAAFDKEYDELINLDVDITKIKLDDVKDLKLSAKSVAQLKALIVP